MSQPLSTPLERGFLRTYPGLAIAGSAAFAMSTLFSAMKPILLTRYLEQVGYSQGLAGLIAAMPFIGIALSSLLMRGPMLRWPYWFIAALFGSILIAGELLSALAFTMPGLVLLLQLACGLSVGLLMGTVARYIATSHTPDKLFGFVDMMAVFGMSFMVYAIGSSVEREGLSGGYLAAAGLSLLFVALLYAFRGTSVDRQKSRVAPNPLDVSLRPIATVAMGVLFVTSSGLGFAFMFSLARDLEMSYDQASTYIGILLFLSAFACQLGGWASARFGSQVPLACAFVCCALGWYGAIYADNWIWFLAALVPAVFSLQFNFPILLALSGQLDAQGQWAGIASPLITSGFAWAAIVAGQIVEHWGIHALAPATATGMLGCLFLLALISRRA